MENKSNRPQLKLGSATNLEEFQKGTLTVLILSDL